MSIELKQAAEKALVVLGSATSFMSRKARDQHESVVAELRTAIQQAEAKTDEPVYWEWRHQGSHPDAVDFGQWSEWKRVEPRSLLHTVDDALREFKGYIARGHKYELRALYTHPAPGVPDGWKLVPIEPTQEMLTAARRATEIEGITTTPWLRGCIYRTMLAASPAQKGGE